MDTGREQRGGEVDERQKDRSEVYQGGGKKRRGSGILTDTPKSAKKIKTLPHMQGSKATKQEVLVANTVANMSK